MTRTKHHDPYYAGAGGTGAFSHDYHLEMVSDAERVGRGMKAIAHYGDAAKTFCELGCGSGVFSIAAAKRFGRVIAVERDESILAVAKENARRAGVGDKITFVHGDALEVGADDLGGRADVIFIEMLSIWLINEPQAVVADRARERLLAPGGVLSPSRVTNLLEIANRDYVFSDVEVKAPLAQFSGVKAPRLLSTSQVAQTVDFSAPTPEEVSGSVTFTALADDLVNCVRLSSLVHFAPNATFHSTDTLMPVTILPTVDELPVCTGDQVRVEFAYRHRSPLQSARFSVSRA